MGAGGHSPARSGPRQCVSAPIDNHAGRARLGRISFGQAEPEGGWHAMAWTIADEEIRNSISGAGDPPADPSADTFWRWAFTQWPAAQDDGTWRRFALLCELTDGASLDELTEQYGGARVLTTIDFEVTAAKPRLAESTDEEARAEIHGALQEELQPWFESFGDDVRELQAWQASAPEISDPEQQRGRVTVEELEANQETLDAYLKYTLDNMELEDTARFHQVGDLILTSWDSWPQRWKDVVHLPGWCDGTMRRKTSMGRMTIQVTGSNDEAGFEKAFRRVSNKVLQFKDAE